MDKSRPLLENCLSTMLILVDLDSDVIFGEDGNDSSDYITSYNKSGYSDEVVFEPDNNHYYVCQVNTSTTNNNLRTENQ